MRFSLLPFKSYLRDLQNKNPRKFSCYLYLSSFFFTLIGLFICNLFASFYFHLNSIMLIPRQLPRDLIYNTTFLNTIITGQITIFLFIISITIVVIQLSSANYPSRYTQILKSYIDLRIIALIFLSSIIYNFLLVFHLSFTPDPPNYLFTISQFFFLLGIVSLFPYFWNILYIIRPENQLNLLYHEIRRRIKQGDFWTSDNHLIAIFDIILGTFYKRDLWTVRNGLDRLNNLIDDEYLPIDRQSTFDIFHLSIEQISKEIIMQNQILDISQSIDILIEKSKRISIMVGLKNSIFASSSDNLQNFINSIEKNLNFWNIKSITLKSIILEMINALYQKTKNNSELVKKNLKRLDEKIQNFINLINDINQCYKNFTIYEKKYDFNSSMLELIKLEDLYTQIPTNDILSINLIVKEFLNMRQIAFYSKDYSSVAQIDRYLLKWNNFVSVDYTYA